MRPLHGSASCPSTLLRRPLSWCKNLIFAPYCANAKGPFNGQRPERAFQIIYQIAIGNVETLFEKQAIGIGQIQTVDHRHETVTREQRLVGRMALKTESGS